MNIAPEAIIERFKKIRSLCDAPHWTASRSHDIRSIADSAIIIMESDLIHVEAMANNLVQPQCQNTGADLDTGTNLELNAKDVNL